MDIKIGLEIHVQLNSKQKLFCKCSSEYKDKEPNSNICPICTGQPGAKPMPPNFEAIKNLVKIGLTLGCKPNKNKIYFLRKHYFYPDLPKNYQITSEPFMIDGNFFGVRIREIHLEEDPGRYDLRNGYVDFNRSGIPLAEIVTEPDLKSPEEAKEWTEKLFFYLKYSKAIKEDPGSIRVDANISIGNNERVEIKNINSISGMYNALKYEILRQTRLIVVGKKVLRETRHFDEEKKITIPLREKETVADYRYIPDPDLNYLLITEKLIEEVKKEVLIPQKIERELRERFGLKDEYINKLMLSPDFLVYSIKILELSKSDKNKISEILTNNIWKFYKDGLFNILSYPPSFVSKIIDDLCTIIERIERKNINYLLETSLLKGSLPSEIAKNENLILESCVDENVMKIVKEVLIKEKKAIKDYLSGNKKAIGYLIGKVLEKSNKKVNPKELSTIIEKEIEKFKHYCE